MNGATEAGAVIDPGSSAPELASALGPGRPPLRALPGASSGAEPPVVLTPQAREDFVQTPHVESLCKRALRYLHAGQAVHLCGPAGTGKTTLAMHLCAQLGRPVVLIHGDEEHRTSDLVGSDVGYQRSRLVDNYIRSVVRTEDSYRRTWVDNRLTTACKNGYVLLYDEFTRSRPEANNILLGILGERVLDLPRGNGGGGGYVPVHPDFAAIFTSNPREYAGVYASQDALLDRMVTLHVDGYDQETETSIVAARSGLDLGRARSIVVVARAIFDRVETPHRSPLRGAIAVARVLARTSARASSDDAVFLETCLDVFGGRIRGQGPDVEPFCHQMLEAIRRVAPASAHPGGE